jgi:lipid-binding SYLF domain-containing protein
MAQPTEGPALQPTTTTTSARTSSGTSTLWDKTKSGSSTVYNKALLPGFNKAYKVVDKLGAPVNRLSNKVGSEAFWPTTMDKESEKAARILRGFCKDGFYEQIEEKELKKVETRNATAVGVPQGKQRVMKKIPASVIKNAVGLAIFTTMRTGWLFGGSGGAGVLIGRNPETREWSPPSGIQTQNISFGFLAGVDIYDTVLVINTYEALGAFTKWRTTLGTEVAVAAGPVGIGGALDTELTKRQAPIWSYVKSRGLYAGVALEGNLVIERTDENARFYGEQISVTDILNGKLRHPPVEQYQVLLDTLRAAQGDDVDDSLLPDAPAPSDMEIIQPGQCVRDLSDCRLIRDRRAYLWDTGRG